ncbi:MAG: VOC family protein [Candidatus Pacebacteria bacterium]|nr:VOC family protein [Candidatus Paceibacterota bacterium]
MKNNRVIHFEIQADDVERAKKFYEKALGWKISQAMTKEKGGMDYWIIDTGTGPGIGGGMYERPKKGEKHYLYDCTVLVEDIDEAVEAVKKNGGVITKEKVTMEGVGLFASVKDTEGNRFALMQATDWKPK